MEAARTLTSEAEVLAQGTDALRIVSFGYGFYALGMVVVQAFNGAGDTRTPTLINLFCYFAFQIPLALSLAHWAGLGARGAFIAVPVAESLMTVVAVLLFRRGRWQAARV